MARHEELPRNANSFLRQAFTELEEGLAGGYQVKVRDAAEKVFGY